jgi:hypothetical protein
MDGGSLLEQLAHASASAANSPEQARRHREPRESGGKFMDGSWTRRASWG